MNAKWFKVKSQQRENKSWELEKRERPNKGCRWKKDRMMYEMEMERNGGTPERHVWGRDKEMKWWCVRSWTRNGRNSSTRLCTQGTRSCLSGRGQEQWEEWEAEREEAMWRRGWTNEKWDGKRGRDREREGSWKTSISFRPLTSVQTVDLWSATREKSVIIKEMGWWREKGVIGIF